MNKSPSSHMTELSIEIGSGVFIALYDESKGIIRKARRSSLRKVVRCVQFVFIGKKRLGVELASLGSFVLVCVVGS